MIVRVNVGVLHYHEGKVKKYKVTGKKKGSKRTAPEVVADVDIGAFGEICGILITS